MQHRNIAGVALLLAALVAEYACDLPRFRKDILVGERPYALATGDFNGDRRPDLAVTTWDGLVVLLNEGQGDFAQPVLNETVRDLVVSGDFDGDGRDDLANRDSILLSRGDGTFVAAQPIAGPPLAGGDFNLDGRGDLLLGGEDGVRLWLGNGDGTFQPGVEVSADPVRQVMVADFNGDGRDDVAVLSTSTPLLPLRVFLGQGDGTFGPGIPTQMDALGLLTADFNGDHLPDLVTQGCVFCEGGTTGIALANGDGTFHPFVSLSTENVLAAADVTGDGWADLVVGNGSTDSIFVYSGLGDGTFDEWIDPHTVGWEPHAAAALDLDEDGRLDVITANFGANTITMLLARAEDSAPPQRAVSTASGVAIVAPGSLATLDPYRGPGSAANATPPWPTSLGGISLEVRDSAGETHLAPLILVSPWRINFQVPTGTAPGEATLSVAGNEVGSMEVASVAPGLFMASPESGIPSATGLLVEPGNIQTPVPVFTCTENSCQAEPIPLSSAGDRPIYLGLYGTGFHGATTENVTCSIYDVPLPVDYAGPQGTTPGLDQINVRLLPEVLVKTEEGLFGPGPVTVTLRINGVAANPAVIDIR